MKIKKKILFLAPSLEIGGAERVLVNLLKKIDLERYDISLCLYSKTGVYFEEMPPRIKIFSIFKLHLLSRVFMFLYRSFGFSLPIKIATRIAIKDKYNWGITFSDGTLTDVMLFAYANFNKTATWVHSCYISQESLRSVYTPQKRQELIKRRYSKVDEIICVSSTSLKEFEELFGFPEKLSLIHNIFESEVTLNRSEEPIDVKFETDIVNIIAVGRLVDVKEYSKLIAASKILVDKGRPVKVRILGDGKLRKQLENEIHRFSLEKHVELFGFIFNPYPYLKKSDILAVTSSSEAFPTVLIEAMTLGVPVMSTSCSGAVEISDNGKYALLSDHTIEDIASKLEFMIRHAEFRRQLAVKAIRRVDFYDEKAVLKQIYQIFEK